MKQGVCEGSGAGCNPRLFGGRWGDNKARCPVCGRWVTAQLTGSRGGTRYGVILAHKAPPRAYAAEAK